MFCCVIRTTFRCHKQWPLGHRCTVAASRRVAEVLRTAAGAWQTVQLLTCKLLTVALQQACPVDVAKGCRSCVASLAEPGSRGVVDGLLTLRLRTRWRCDEDRCVGLRFAKHARLDCNNAAC